MVRPEKTTVSDKNGLVSRIGRLLDVPDQQFWSAQQQIRGGERICLLQIRIGRSLLFLANDANTFKEIYAQARHFKSPILIVAVPADVVERRFSQKSNKEQSSRLA